MDSIKRLQERVAELERDLNSAIGALDVMTEQWANSEDCVAVLKARLYGPGRYLVDGGRGRRVFKTLAEAREWANAQIKVYSARAGRTGKWPRQVAHVAIWVGLEQARALLLEDGHDFELMPMPDQSGEGE